MESIQDALGALFLASGLVIVIYIIARYTYLIRKAMLDSGWQPKPNARKMYYLDIGCIILGLGIGLIVSTLFTSLDLSENTTDLFVWGTILIFGSGGLLLAHYLRSRRK